MRQRQQFQHALSKAAFTLKHFFGVFRCVHISSNFYRCIVSIVVVVAYNRLKVWVAPQVNIINNSGNCVLPLSSICAGKY